MWGCCGGVRDGQLSAVVEPPAAALIRWFLLQREEGTTCAHWLDLQDSHYAALAAVPAVCHLDAGLYLDI